MPGKPNWKKIKAEYIGGSVSYRKLAEKYGVSSSAVYRRMRSEKWTDLRMQSESKANAKIVEKEAEKAARKASRIDTAADILLETIIRNLHSGEFAMNPQGVKQLTGALKDLKDIKGMKSEADMREQEARIRKLEKDAMEEQKADNRIEIVFDSDLEMYSE